MLLCLTARAKAPAEVVTGLAVTVHDSVITLGEINGLVSQGIPTITKNFPGDLPRQQLEVKKLSDSIIEAMVEDKLILHDFVTAGFVTNVLEAFIDERIQETIQRQYYGDRARLIRSLHEEGLTYESWRRSQRDHWIITIMKDQNASHITKILVSPLKIQQYYDAHPDEFKLEDQVKLRMIVLTNAPDGSSQKLAREILAKLDSGVPFAELASIYSADGQRNPGGDRGWITVNLFKKSLSKVAFSLKPGEHSGILEEPEACYLLMVEDVKTAHVKPLMEVRGEIDKTLRSQENGRLFQLWMQRLKRKTSVLYY